MQDSAPIGRPSFGAHPRSFAANRYVYPVLSRRAGGISIGVNLSLDQVCNFHCIYCQVVRGKPDGTDRVDLERLREELDDMVEQAASGRLFEGPLFRNTPVSLRRLNDIALSGDGEPTACPDFERVVQVCADVRQRYGLSDLKLVLITNATLLHRSRVREALKTLDASGGEIWAKLDAGTEEYYRLVARSTVPWRQILENLRQTAIERPIVIQSLFMQIREQPPSREELEAYCDRLLEIVSAGGQIKLVQIHTVARRPAEAWVAALSDEDVDMIADLVHRRTNLPVRAFYGASW